MLDDSLPTFQFKTSEDNSLNTLLYFSHNGSDPTIQYVIRRPSPATSKNQYALGLADPNYSSVIYGEVLVRPEWTQPSLSASELRANGGQTPVVPITPDDFGVMLYNPDQTIGVKCHQGKWTKSDSWEFEIPEHTFKKPSVSQLDQESGSDRIAELTPKVLFRWKRDSKLSKDMTCYMTGRSVGGRKSKEPDITVAMLRAGRHSTSVSIYEPNMPRVEVEDRKGLDLVFLLTAAVIKDLYLIPRQDVFNTSGTATPPDGRRPNNVATPPSPIRPGEVYASGALGFPGPPPGPPPPSQPPRPDARQQAGIDAETKRLKALVLEEQRDREKREAEEQRRIREMLDREEHDRHRRQADIDRETERLRQQYGYDNGPVLPPRPGPGPGQGNYQGGPLQPPPGPPPRPNSVGPSGQSGSSGRHKLGQALGNLIGHRGDESKVQKKRSTNF